MTTISFKVEDEELEAFLDEQENRSEVIREALRVYRWQQEGVEDERLTDQQRVAYQWMLEQTDGGGRLSLEVAKSVLSQHLSLQKGILKHHVFAPLERMGYIRVVMRLSYVSLIVLAPSAVDPPEDIPGSSKETSVKQPKSNDSPAFDADDPDQASERLDEIAAGTPVR